MVTLRNILGVIIGVLTTFVVTFIAAFWYDNFEIGMQLYAMSNPAIPHMFVALASAGLGSAFCSFVCVKNKNDIKIGVNIFGIILVLWAIIDIISSIIYSTFTFDFLWGKIVFAGIGVLSIYFELNSKKNM